MITVVSWIIDMISQMVKAMAEQRGWQHRGHAQLFDAVATIAAETGDDDVDRLFELASAMHANFYEEWYGAGRGCPLSRVNQFADLASSSFAGASPRPRYSRRVAGRHR